MKPRLNPGVLLWFGLLGAPFAWVLQFLFGFGLTEAACSAGGNPGLAVDGLTLAATAVGAAVAVLAGVAAVETFRRTRQAEGAGGSEEDPPKGRVHFLATIGVVISPLFLFIIVMSGVGVLSLPNCNQG